MYTTTCADLEGRGSGGPDPPGKFKFLNSHSKITEYSPGPPPPENSNITRTPLPHESILDSCMY